MRISIWQKIEPMHNARAIARATTILTAESAMIRLFCVPTEQWQLLSKAKTNAVIHPDNRITSKSIGAKTMPGNPSKSKPEPKLYKCPLRRIISPIYIKNVMTDVEIAGTQTDRSFRFSKRNEPTNTPAVIPNKTKNIVINAADNADT